MKKSFLNSSSPFITEMVQVPTAEQAQLKIKKAVESGATAIGFQMNALKKEYRTEKTLKQIFSLSKDKPIYFTNYRSGFNAGMSDEELMEGLFFGIKCGATLVDVMGDVFCPSPEELTMDEIAIKKQMDLIDRIHAVGGEVIMSSHIFQFRSLERVLEIALEHQKRGADVVKIVTGAENEEQELKNLEICNLLKKELKVPFLFLSGGSHNYLHRTLGPAFGACMWLCFCEYDDTTYVGPPLLADVLRIKQALKL